MGKSLKRTLTLLLAAAMMLGMTISASAAGGVSVQLNGKVISTEAYVDGNDRTQAPLAIGQALRMNVIPNGAATIFNKGRVYTAVTAGQQIGDTTAVEGYVPLRYLAEAFGLGISWDGANQTVKLEETATDFDSITKLDTDWSQAAQLPLTGYFTRTFEDGRTVKVYIADEASIRTYITVVAVPDGVNTYSYLQENGWFDLMDRKGEALFVLEPGANGWGTVEQEKGYIAEAVGFLKSGVNGNGVGVFSTFGEFYLVGIGAGAAPLEAWAAENPIFVISQVYINGKSAGASVLNAAGSGTYDGTNTSGYHPGLTEDADFQASLKATGLRAIARKDVPVPTWFAGYAANSDSLTYWKAANNCVAAASGGTFYQAVNSTAPQTLYANSQLTGHGISQVKVTTGTPSAADIYAFLSTYTRYDNSFAYSNAIAYRLDYTAARVGAQQQAQAGTMSETIQSANGSVTITGTSDVAVGNGTVEFGVFAFRDSTGDARNDPREYMLYVPNGFEGQKLPVVVVYPGMTQTDEIFFDCTQWWQVADKEGFAVAVVCETYSAPTAVNHQDSDLYQAALMAVLEQKVDGRLADLDLTRVYGTGQSMGSMTTQGFVRTNPEFFAAVASTSGLCGLEPGAALPDGVGKPIPAFLIAGQSDLPNLLPDLWHSDVTIDWIEYLFQVNGMADAKIGSADDEHELVSSRTNVYTWKNSAGIPLVQWGQTLLRPHNCYPSEMPLMWDFMKHYSMDEAGNRYYSTSAFAQDDAVALFK